MAVNALAATPLTPYRVRDMINLFNSLDAKFRSTEPHREAIMGLGMSSRQIKAKTSGKALPSTLNSTSTLPMAQNGVKLLEYKTISPSGDCSEEKSSSKASTERPIKQNTISTPYVPRFAKGDKSNPVVAMAASESVPVSLPKALVTLPSAYIEKKNHKSSSQLAEASHAQRKLDQRTMEQEKPGILDNVDDGFSCQADSRTSKVMRAFSRRNGSMCPPQTARCSKHHNFGKRVLEKSSTTPENLSSKQGAKDSNQISSITAGKRAKRPFTQQEAQEDCARPTKKIKASGHWGSFRAVGTDTIPRSTNSFYAVPDAMNEYSCRTDIHDEPGRPVPEAKLIEWKEERDQEGYTDEHFTSTDDEHSAGCIFSTYFLCDPWLSEDHLSSNARKRLDAKRLGTVDEESKCNGTQNIATMAREEWASDLEEAHSPDMLRGKVFFASDSMRRRSERRRKHQIVERRWKIFNRQLKRRKQNSEYHLSKAGRGGIVPPPPTSANSIVINEDSDDSEGRPTKGKKDDQGTTSKPSSIGYVAYSSHRPQLDLCCALAVTEQSEAHDMSGIQQGEAESYNKHDVKRRDMLNRTVPDTQQQTRGRGSFEAATIPPDGEDCSPSTHRGQLQLKKDRKKCINLPSDLVEPSLHVAQAKTTLSDNNMLERYKECTEVFDDTVYNDRDLAGNACEGSTTHRVGRICQTLDRILAEHQEALSAITRNLAQQLSRIDADMGRAGLRTDGLTGSQRHETKGKHASALEEYPDSVMALIDRVEATATTLGGLAQHRDRPRCSGEDVADGGQRCTCKSFVHPTCKVVDSTSGVEALEAVTPSLEA